MNAGARPSAPAGPATRLLQGLVLLLGLAYAGARFPGGFALLDNLSNFPAHFAVALLACAALLAWRGSRGFALAAVAASALAIAQLAPWLGGGAALANPARAPVELLVSNVRHSNHEHGRLLRLIAAEKPDVIGLVEVTKRWLRGLEALRAQYPYRYEMPDELHAGLSLYSRLPLEDARVLELPGEPSRPAIAATLTAPGGDVEIVLVHPISPLNAEAIRRRNGQILALARYARAADLPLVMAGDFNLTMWNRGYRPLVKLGGLINAREGHGIAPTWPAIGPFGVPIDHVLATPGVELREFRVLDGIGSDHLPIFAEFSTR